MCTYEQKKASSESRGIDFTFTEEEWSYLQRKKSKVTCGYSGATMSTNQNKNTTASLERMDAHGAYSLENCIWVGKQLNEVKGLFFDTRNKGDTFEPKALSPAHTLYVPWKTIYNVIKYEGWEQTCWFKQFSDCPKHLVPVKYRHLFPQYVYDETQTSDTPTDKINTVIPVNIELQVTPTDKEEDTPMVDLPTTTEQQPSKQLTKYDFDVYVSKQYYFLYDMATKASIDFEVTLSDVSKLLSRKTSSLDPKEVVSFFAGEEPKLFVKDPMKPLAKYNLLVVSKATLQKLIAMTTASGMSLVQMKQLLNNI